MEDAKIDLTPVVDTLKTNMHKEGRGAVLILGSRASGIFRSQDFYNTMKLYGHPSFEQQPRVKQFAESYKLLTAFTWDEIDTVLIASLSDVNSIDADAYLAKLVKQKVFDIIVSTNVDNLLEQTLEREGLRELHDFDILNPRPDTTVRYDQKFPRRIIKVFGELRTREYSYTLMHLHNAQQLKGLLKTELERDILAIGLDPVWDAEILNTIPSEGKTFWYISDEEPDKSSALYEISKTRSCKLLVGINGSYGHAMKELSEFLLEKTPLDTTLSGLIEAIRRLVCTTDLSGSAPLENMIENIRSLVSTSSSSSSITPEEVSEDIYDLQTPSITKPLPEKEKPLTLEEVSEGMRGLETIPVTPLPEKSRSATQTSLEVFISYVPEDEGLCEELKTHLSALKRQNIINMWDRRRIIAGKNRKNEIDQHLNSASIILLLVSANFIDSDDYIHSVELERALELHEGGRAQVIPVILRPVDWQETLFGGLEPLPTNGKPVTKWDDHDSAFLDIVEGIKKVIESLRQNEL